MQKHNQKHITNKIDINSNAITFVLLAIYSWLVPICNAVV